MNKNRESLNVWTVPTGCILSVGTVPIACILSVGTVPRFNLSHKNKDSFVFSEDRAV